MKTQLLKKAGPKKQRRQYVVDAAYQLRFVLWLFGIVVAIVALTGCVIAISILLFSLDNPQMERHAAFVAVVIALAITLLAELFLAIPVIFYFGIRESHRVVGPTRKLRRTLDAVGKGDFTQRLSVRRSDVMRDVADAINDMVQNLQNRFSKPFGG